MWKCNNIYRCLIRRRPLFIENRQHISQSSILKKLFFERDPRGEDYRIHRDIDFKKHIIEGQKIFVDECKLFVEETKEYFRSDPKRYKDGDTDVFWRFDSEECLKKWRIGYDQMHNEGFSNCTLVVNDRKKGVFSGNIDTTMPKDGVRRYTGYCGIKSVKKKISFQRDACFDWREFTHLELRVKGDGRNYLVNLGLGMYYDVSWFDTYTYTMFTHGGPYWQLIRIPFSKFYFHSKGRLQDEQHPIPLNKVDSIGFTAAGVPGPFCLEIDYIGCHVDYNHTERFAYEMYRIPKEIVTLS
ncbi:hypothetical protein JTE90_004912 [Oedothorax gibbosus]|uniref:NADH:ubiquinone oxidoreductase intermediate-associated protein 30 domain-containing protein n=1 Tax=Oedothorax gibbosus TaxID=931172 RepID=A0AAV6UKY1_9ARAC|nr:hypothetical protein JTE90_004912 [Oedothorax gibbosus]